MSESLPHSLAKTLKIMFEREQERIAHGHYKRSRTEFWVTFTLVLIFATIIGYVVFGQSSLQYYLDNWQGLGLLGVTFPLFIYILLQLSLFLRWVLYWAVLTAALLLLIRPRNLQDSGKYQEEGKIILIAFASIELLTILVYFFQRYVYVKILRQMTDQSPERFFKVKATDKEDCYKAKGLWEFGKKKHFSYVGDRNPAGQPHGYGVFTSRWKYGEILNGFWVDGVPIGPFISREYITGYTFRNVRIGYFACGKTFDRYSQVRGKEIKYGVAAVECNVSGRFFSDFPKAQMLFTDPFRKKMKKRRNKREMLSSQGKNIENMKDVLDNLRPDIAPPNPITSYASQNRITVEYLPQTGFRIPGFRPAAGSPSTLEDEDVKLSLRVCKDFSQTQSSQLTIDGWTRENNQTEAVLFVPGFNTTVEASLKSLGQLICLGNLSPDYKCIVFSWPGGSLLQFPYAVGIAESVQTTYDFIQAIRELSLAGITKVHILCHSLGSRVAMSAVSRFDQVFKPQTGVTNSQPFGEDFRIELGSVTLLNPEASLSQFVTYQYDIIKSYTDLITLYSNKQDVALMTAEIVNWDKMLGKSVDGLHREILTDQDEFIYLDMDVIDTSDLDVNMSGAKHAYFNLNKHIVDDICDVIQHGKRALERNHRLLPMDGNVFGILSAPSYISN
jgi:esterase/lipase superfamily enzyme